MPCSKRTLVGGLTRALGQPEPVRTPGQRTLYCWSGVSREAVTTLLGPPVDDHSLDADAALTGYVEWQQEQPTGWVVTLFRDGELRVN